MSTNPSLLARARSLAVALVVALVAASCGGGDESVSSRTRNAGAAPTLEECVALLGLQICHEHRSECSHQLGLQPELPDLGASSCKVIKNNMHFPR